MILLGPMTPLTTPIKSRIVLYLWNAELREYKEQTDNLITPWVMDSQWVNFYDLKLCPQSLYVYSDGTIHIYAVPVTT